MAKLLEYNATLVARQDLSDGLSIFQFEPDCTLPEAPWFTAGQYMVIGLNNEQSEELGSVQRPMSIASSPLERTRIEFYIRFVAKPASDNPLTHLLWPLEVGDRAYLRPKPKGKFTLEHIVEADDPRRVVFVGAGTGLAPFVSIVRELSVANPERLSRVAILHGASYPQDLGYADELSILSAQHGLIYVPTVSRPQDGDGWRGAVGRAEDRFRPEFVGELEEQLGLERGEFTPTNAVVLVCGLQGTIGDSIVRLADRGFVPESRKLRTAFEVPDERPNSLFFEQYDTEPVIDLEDTALVEGLTKAFSTAQPPSR